mgnify:FL=1
MSSEVLNTKARLLAAAFELIGRESAANFSTRAICDIANVTAPTLYHHFGSADGLLSAVISEAFDQFLASKRARNSPDPILALVQSWDAYVEFAAARPRLYGAMMARFLTGADLPAAREGQAMLSSSIMQIDAADLLAIPPAAAVQLIWVSANAAALMFLAAKMQPGLAIREPDAAILATMRDSAIKIICKPT